MPNTLAEPVGEREIVARMERKMANEKSANEYTGFFAVYVEGLVFALNLVLVAILLNVRNQLEVTTEIE